MVRSIAVMVVYSVWLSCSCIRGSLLTPFLFYFLFAGCFSFLFLFLGSALRCQLPPTYSLLVSLNGFYSRYVMNSMQCRLFEKRMAFFALLYIIHGYSAIAYPFLESSVSNRTLPQPLYKKGCIVPDFAIGTMQRRALIVYGSPPLMYSKMVTRRDLICRVP